MKFVNLDESEIIEQPLEKVIARPDYSPIEFGYDNLCSLDSVSVDGIHPSGGDSDLILPPSVNKINSCFKSEYFKISNLFSEIQTYEQKQEALKNLGLLGAINNSTYIHDLGRFDKQVDAEEEAVKVANDSNIIIMLYHIGSQNGIILQQVGDTITKQILLWDNTIFQRHINFSDSSKTQVSSTSYWWKLGATHISYDPDTRKFHLQDMNYKNLNPTVDSEVPLASSTKDGFMSKELAQKLGTTLVKNDITNNLTTSSSTKVLSAQMGKTLKTEIDKLQLLAIKDLGTDLQPHIATGNIITYVKDNNIKETVLFKYIDTDGSSTLGVCISRINDIGWIIYLVARKGIERLVFNSNGVREEWNEYGGVLRHNLDSVADEQLECLSVKGVKSLLSTKLDALSPGDGITMMNNTVSTLIGNGLTYNGREIVIDHDLTLKTNNGKLGVNAGDGLYVNPDNELGINVGKGLTINHTDSTVEVAKEVLEEIDSKAPLEGYAPNLKVRFSDGLVGRIETIPHEIGRISPTAGISVDDNSATIERIEGNSVVWNQLVNNNSLPKTGVYNDVELTNNNNGTFTVNGTPLSSTSSILINFGIQKYGHKYLFEGIPSRDPITETFCRIHYIKDGTNNVLKTVDETGNCFFSLSTTIDVELRGYLYIRPNYTVTNKTYAPKLYDLTLMFGAGNEPTTIEEFEARKPLGVTNEYNEGTIVSFQGGDVKSVGFNAFTAENSEAGSIDTATGLNMTSKTFSRSDFIPCVGNTQYEAIMGNHFYEYDADRNFIRYTSIQELGDIPKTTIVTTNKKTRYMRVVYKLINETKVCIHLVHSGYRNGEYEPYVKDIHPLPDIKSIKDSNGDTLFPYGLLSAGSVYDEITTTKAIKRIGVVDMGTQVWSKEEGMSRFVAQINGMTTSNGQFGSNVLISLYTATTINANRGGLDKSIAYANGYISIVDTAYIDVTSFKAAMSGVLLYYELATPIEVDLPEELNMTYEAWDFGTEELVVSEPSTSLKGEIIYHFNAVDRIRENSRAIETLKEHVEELIDNKLDSNDIVNDLTTGGADKALSAEMGKELSAELTELETLKYPLFDLEVEKANKKWYDSGYLTSFIDVKLGFNYDGSKYFVYLGNGLISNNILNPNGFIHLYKDGSNFLTLRPIESSSNEARIFKSTDGFNTIVLDITKLDPTYDFSLTVNSGVNLSSKCFGFTDRADIKLLEDNVDVLHQSVSELQGNEHILFPYVTPSPLYGTETSSIQNYGPLSRQFIKELYIYDKSKIQNEDITSVFINLVARNNSTYGWLIWFRGFDKEGTSSQDFIRAKTGGKNFDESTEIIELVYNDTNGSSPCGYIIVDWSFIEDGVNLNTVFKWNLTEHCLDIVYSPIIKAYLDDKNIKDSISETNNNVEAVNRAVNLTKETLVQDSIITQYVNAVGAIANGAGGYGSYVYNIEGVTGKFKVTAGVSNNNLVSICRIDDANGNRMTKYPLVTTDISADQFITIREEDNAKTLYVSVTMANNVTTKPSVVVVENSNLTNLENNIEDLQEELQNLSDKIVVFDKKRVTESDKVVDSSIVNPLKCFSDKANNFGTNNAYKYWYTLFRLPAHTRCVPFERKNTMDTNVALVVKVDSLDQFKLNGSYTRLVAGGDVDTSSYGTDEVYQHKPIEFDEDTYIAVLSNSETDYTKFCYLEFWTATDITLTDINNRVLELEDVGVEKPKPYEIVIPDKVYAVVGDTLQIFYDSVFNVQNLANYQVQVLSDKGKAYPRYFEYNPTSSDVGETTLTFNLCEVTDCTTGITKVLTSKEVNLITVPALTNNISANVLCVGDSTTSGGTWCKELARRFYANDGTPQGLGLANINICGRKTGIVANKTYGWEGTGGWTWSTYVSNPVDAVRFTVTNVSSLVMGANYIASNGVIFEIVEINVTDGVGNIRCQYSWDTPNKNEIPASGTLTKRYSTQGGDDTITYTSYESENFSPFYVDGEVDFIDYANKYCNGIINVIVIHLGINSMFGLKTNLASHLTSIMNTAKIFIDKFHEQFPNSEVLLITPPKCSIIGGMAANYNATQTATEGIYNRQMFQYHKRYFELANQPEYKNWVTVVNTCGEFDTPYGYPYNEKGVDTRVSNIKERIGTNGVHPNADGYNMIADSVYRTLSGIL